MLCGINQKSEGLLRIIKDNGCLFLCFAEVSPIAFIGTEGIKALNYLWEKAKDKRIIDSDNVIQNHNAVADLFCLKVKYDDKHHDADEAIPNNVAFVFGQYFWKYGHFVVLNKNKEVSLDPLVISNTVKNGVLKSMRWYYYAD